MSSGRDQFDYIRNAYKVDPKVGQRVIVDGKQGVIKGARGNYLRVLFDGAKNALNCHPTWKITYK